MTAVRASSGIMARILTTALSNSSGALSANAGAQNPKKMAKATKRHLFFIGKPSFQIFDHSQNKN
jgi:hypothetical protein